MRALPGSKAVGRGGVDGVGVAAHGKPWRSVKASIMEALSSAHRFILFSIDHRRRSVRLLRMNRIPLFLSPTVRARESGAGSLAATVDRARMKAWKEGVKAQKRKASGVVGGRKMETHTQKNGVVVGPFHVCAFVCTSIVQFHSLWMFPCLHNASTALLSYLNIFLKLHFTKSIFFYSFSFAKLGYFNAVCLTC